MSSLFSLCVFTRAALSTSPARSLVRRRVAVVDCRLLLLLLLLLLLSSLLLAFLAVARWAKAGVYQKPEGQNCGS